MGVLQGTGVHRHVSAGVCRSVIITEDNAPTYDTISGAESSLNLLGVVLWTGVQNIVRDAGALTTNNTWHYPQECPYANG